MVVKAILLGPCTVNTLLFGYTTANEFIIDGGS